VTPVIPIINGLLFFSTITSLFLTGFTDPGIIPRKNILELNKRQDISDYLKNEKGVEDPKYMQ